MKLRQKMILKRLEPDIERINLALSGNLATHVTLISQVWDHILISGGKRIRPLLFLLAARMCGCREDHLPEVSTIFEYLHAATLLHDDVVDDSRLRRGRETANSLWGNEASVLVGDFLYSRAFQMMVALSDLRVLEIMADATNIIAEGEVMQLANCHDPDITEQRYLDTIRYKTARLFEAAAQLGVVVASGSLERQQALAAYGRHLGTAFQLVDDALDYQSDSATLGKNLGDDLAEGKPTLPLLYALWNGNAAESELIRTAIEKGGREQLPEIRAAIESTGAITYTLALAEREAAEADAALVAIPPSEFRDVLSGLARFAVQRQY